MKLKIRQPASIEAGRLPSEGGLTVGMLYRITNDWNSPRTWKGGPRIYKVTITPKTKDYWDV